MTPEIYNDKRFGINQNHISKNALNIISKLHKSGFEAYIVGGGIRDMIKGLKPKDFDIVTNCEPEEIRKIFRNSRIIGRRFKLVHIAFVDEIIDDFITYEKDGCKIFVDSNSISFLKGSMVDYVDEGLNQGIKFINPNAKAVCGCGESFTL